MTTAPADGLLRRWLRRLATRLLSPSLLRRLKKRYYVLLHRRGAGEEKEMRLLSFFVAAGDTVLDLGANVGFYTVRLAKLVGPGGAVHAFEPIPETLDILRHVMRSLKLGNVVLHECAVADRDEVVEMAVPEARDGVANYYLAHVTAAASSSGRHVSVRAQSLDSMRKSGLARPSFIKCDVEGAEMLVLRGARTVLGSDRPVLLCEVSSFAERLGNNAQEVFTCLDDAGYRGYTCEGVSLIGCAGPRSDEVNYYFLPIERALPPGLVRGGPGS